MIYDKRTATNVIGCLMKKPDFLVDTDKFMLDKDDFQIPLHRIVFSAIYNLFHQGAEKITINDLHVYLQKYPELYSLFNQNKGSDFILAAEETGEVENFVFYYDRVKKLSLLRNLKEANFYIGDWYAEGSYDIKERQNLEKKLEDALPQEIITSIQGKLFDIESNFVNKKTFHYGEANIGIEDLIASLKEVPEVGLPLQGEMFTTVCRGARKGKMYLMSGGTGMGKSRLAVGNACHLAYPIRWDRNKAKWVNVGSSQKILFITTELAFDEIQTMIIANISAVNEEKILNGSYSESEEIRVKKAIQIMKHFSHNFHLYHMPDPSVEQLNSNVRRLVIGKQIQAVFFDYISTSPALLAEFSSSRLREDVILNILSTALKNLANELGIFVWSGTQLNAHANEADFVDESGIRGARAIIDKADFACAIQPVTKEALKMLAPVLKNGAIRPNMYMDIFKNRRGKHRRVRLWMEVDLGCCRTTDLYLTTEHGEPIDLDILYTIDSSAKIDTLEFFGAIPAPKSEEKIKPNSIKITI